MAFIARGMRGFSSIMNTNAYSRISRISPPHFSLFNASPHPAKFSVSYTSYRRIFSAEDDHPKSLRPWCEAILKYFKVTPSEFERCCVIMAILDIEWERGSGRAPTIEPEYSIRRKILQLESELAPELDDPKTVVDDPDKLPLSYLYYWLYTEEKWSMILQKKDDPRVQQLKGLIEKAEISQDVFRQSLGQFSLTPSKDNDSYTRPLTEFDLHEIEYCLDSLFSDKPPHIIFDARSITHVLMKL